MSNFEVSDPILNSPFEESQAHWWILPVKIARRCLSLLGLHVIVFPTKCFEAV